MSVVEMNNEVVRMRRFVRKARTCVVSKLVREAKSLRKRHGDEKQQQKFTRKADRLIQEVLALKKIKDDDIILHGIENTTELNDVLKDLSATEDIRVMARVINHKDMKMQLQKFRETFPDHKGYVNARRKKSIKLKKKVKEKKQGKIKTDKVPAKKSVSVDSEANSSNDKLPAKKSAFADSEANSSNDKMPAEKSISVDSTASSSDSYSDEETITSDKNSSPSIVVKNNKKIQHATPVKSAKKLKCSDDSETETQEEEEEEEQEEEVSSVNDSENVSIVKPLPVVKVIGKEATVKRFTEFLQTQDKSLHEDIGQKEIPNTQTSAIKSATEKENDAFFICEDGSDFQVTSNDWKSREEDCDYENERSSNDHIFNSSKLRERNNKREFLERRGDKGGRFGKKYMGSLKSQPRRFENTDTFDRQSKRNLMPKSMPQKRTIERNDTIKTENEKLHPSWEAKKKQKEIMSSGFQGKRIVFDDD